MLPVKAIIFLTCGVLVNALPVGPESSSIYPRADDVKSVDAGIYRGEKAGLWQAAMFRKARADTKGQSILGQNERSKVLIKIVYQQNKIFMCPLRNADTWWRFWEFVLEPAEFCQTTANFQVDRLIAGGNWQGKCVGRLYPTSHWRRLSCRTSTWQHSGA